MNMFYKILLRPILTEKMAILQERSNKYAFIVPRDCNKNIIKQAVEQKFDVRVLKVSSPPTKKLLLHFIKMIV